MRLDKNCKLKVFICSFYMRGFGYVYIYPLSVPISQGSQKWGLDSQELKLRQLWAIIRVLRIELGSSGRLACVLWHWPLPLPLGKYSYWSNRKPALQKWILDGLWAITSWTVAHSYLGLLWFTSKYGIFLEVACYQCWLHKNMNNKRPTWQLFLQTLRWYGHYRLKFSVKVILNFHLY